MATFNLVEQPWIPITTYSRASPELVSLSTIFAQAHEIREIIDPSPLNVIALTRLLLAILHRAYDGPKTTAEWGTLWNRNAFDMGPVTHYLDHWKTRFDLFDANHPFYQTPGLRNLVPRAGSILQIAFDCASERNASLLFDHSPSTRTLTPAIAARALLATQAFSASGMLTCESTATKFARASTLAGRAVCAFHGVNLFQTLLLNLQHYHHAREYPFPVHTQDMPAWERDTYTKPEDRFPTGYTDLLTWQSRRVEIIPNLTDEQELVVSQAIVMKGESIASNFHVPSREPMVAYYTNESKKDGDPWVPVSLREDRLIWRDSYALMSSIEDRFMKVPLLQWLDRLYDDGYLDPDIPLPMDIFGSITDQANYVDWRHERLPLSIAYLQEKDMIDQVHTALEIAERGERLLKPGFIQFKQKNIPSPMYELCELILSATSERKIKIDAIKNFAGSFGCIQQYWANLDSAFYKFLANLPADITYDEGVKKYGKQSVQQWQEQVTESCRTVFLKAINNLGTSARSLRAGAMAERSFRFLIKEYVQQSSLEEGTEESYGHPVEPIH